MGGEGAWGSGELVDLGGGSGHGAYLPQEAVDTLTSAGKAHEKKIGSAWGYPGGFGLYEECSKF